MKLSVSVSKKQLTKIGFLTMDGAAHFSKNETRTFLFSGLSKKNHNSIVDFIYAKDFVSIISEKIVLFYYYRR